MTFYRLAYAASFAVVSAFTFVSHSNATDDAVAKKVPKTPSNLFQSTMIWDVHLSYTPDQWEAMEPKDNGRSRGFGFGRGGEAEYSSRLAPAMLHYGGADEQGRLSRTSFTTLSGKWFAAWDKDANEAIDQQELSDGLNAVAPPRAGGMNLQGPEGARNGIAAAFGIEYVYVHADLEFEGQTVKDVGVRYKGGGTFLESRGSIKRPLKVSLNKYVKGQKLAAVSTLNLANCVTDASYMNEVLAHQLYRDAGVPAPRTAYARVAVTVPDKYDRKLFGLYSLVENVDKNFASDVLDVKKGAIFKPVTPNLFAYLGHDWKHYNQTYDPKGDPAEKQRQRLIELCRLVTYAHDEEFAAKIGDFIDLDNFSRYMAVMVYLSDFDGILGPGQNFYIHLHPKSDKFSFIPWDQDRSFGQFRGSQEQREQLSIHRPWQGQNRFLERIYNVEAFKKQYTARLDEFSTTIFEPDRFAKQIDTIAGSIRPIVQEESDEKLARFDKVVAGEITEPTAQGRRFGGNPSKPVKPFVRVRTASILDQLAGKSEGVDFDSGGRGGRGRFGGRGGQRRGSSPADAFLTSMDADENNTLSREEFVDGFAQWFQAWAPSHSELLTEDELRAGIDANLTGDRR